MRSRWWFVVLVVGLSTVVAACAGDHPAEPTISTVPFTPRLVVTVDDSGFAVARGQTDDPSISADPPTAPTGTVIEVRNGGSGDHRVTNGGAIDTGVLQPGDTTTVVLRDVGDLELRDDTTDATVTIAVTAREP